MLTGACLCQGSVGNVHVSCQEKWRDVDWMRVRCDICHAPYLNATRKQLGLLCVLFAVSDFFLWLSLNFWTAIVAGMYTYKSGIVDSVHTRISHTDYRTVAIILQVLLNVGTGLLWTASLILGSKLCSFINSHIFLAEDVFSRVVRFKIPRGVLIIARTIVLAFSIDYTVSFVPREDSLTAEILTSLCIIAGISGVIARIYDASTAGGNHFNKLFGCGATVWAVSWIAVKSGMVIEV